MSYYYGSSGRRKERLDRLVSDLVKHSATADDAADRNGYSARSYFNPVEAKRELMDLVYRIRDPQCKDWEHIYSSNYGSSFTSASSSESSRKTGVNCAKNPNCFVGLAVDPIVVPGEDVSAEEVASLVSRWRHKKAAADASAAASAAKATATTTTTTTTTTATPQATPLTSSSSSLFSKLTSSSSRFSKSSSTKPVSNTTSTAVVPTASVAKPVIVCQDGLRVKLSDLASSSTTGSSSVSSSAPPSGRKGSSSHKPNPRSTLQIDCPLTHPFIGLQNLGSTCYMNSVLQCIFGDTNLFNLLLLLDPSLLVGPKKDDPLSELRKKICTDLQGLLLAMKLSVQKSLSPETFASTLQISTSTQQDPHEFYSLLMGRIEEQFVKSHPGELLNAFQYLVTGYVEYSTKCTNCRKYVPSKDPFFEIKLNIKGHHSLQGCLHDYFKEEELSGFHLCGCSRGTIMRATRISRLPGVLKLHLMRFSFNTESSKEEKLMDSIKIETKLSMKEFLSDSALHQKDATHPHRYELFAVLSHIGVSIHGGHYIAYVLDRSTDMWWKCDDLRITQCPEFPPPLTETNETPYMLFYQNKSHTIPDTTPRTSFVLSLIEQITAENVELEKKYYELTIEERDHQESARSYLQLYSTIHDKIPSQSETEYHWIEVGWLRNWMSGGQAAIPPIDNASLVCEHGNAKLEKGATTHMKRISVPVWEMFHATYGGGPALSHEHCCLLCLETWIARRDSLKQMKEMKSDMQHRLESQYVSQGYHISRKFIERFKETSASTRIPVVQLTEDILCKHKKLFPLDNAKLISDEIWEYFLTQCEGTIRPDQTLYHQDTECRDCRKDYERKRNDSVRITNHLNNEYFDIGNSFIRYPYDIQERTQYCLVSSAWYQIWSSYTSSRDSMSASRPGPIDNSKFVCQHNKVGINVIEKVFTMQFVSCNAESSPFRILPEKLFSILVERYSLKEGSKIVLRINTNRNYSSYWNGSQVDYALTPDLCEECVSQSAQESMAEKFNFVDEYLEVTKASGSRLWLSQPMKRIKVSSTTPVSELRLLILQEMEIEPVRQRLTFVNPVTRKTTELKTGTLGENKVSQTSTITVAELDEDDPTIMEELGGAPPASTTKRALAFEGTGLSSTPMPKPPPPTTQTAAPKGKPCPSCTFINPLKATSCEMCDGAL